MTVSQIGCWLTHIWEKESVQIISINCDLELIQHQYVGGDGKKSSRILLVVSFLQVEIKGTKVRIKERCPLSSVARNSAGIHLVQINLCWWS